MILSITPSSQTGCQLHPEILVRFAKAALFVTTNYNTLIETLAIGERGKFCDDVYCFVDWLMMVVVSSCESFDLKLFISNLLLSNI